MIAHTQTIFVNDPRGIPGDCMRTAVASLLDIVFRDAYVHLEDLGDAYMLIIEDTDKHVHVTIPARRHRKAFIYEQFDKTKGTVTP